MSIFDKLRVRDTQQWRRDTIRPPLVELTSEATGRTQPCIDRHAEYIAELKVSTIFWANTAQLSGARKAAVDMLAYELYGNLHPHLRRLRNCIWSGDKEGAMECTSLIEKEMTP